MSQFEKADGKRFYAGLTESLIRSPFLSSRPHNGDEAPIALPGSARIKYFEMHA